MNDCETALIDHVLDVASGRTEPDPDDIENRGTRRAEYEGPVAFVQWTPTGGKSISTVVHCKNLSAGGMCVVSRYMLHAGHEGVMLVPRTNGEPVMVGVRVIHSRYVGEMKHESGMAFREIPATFTVDDFRDEQGNMPRLGRQAA